MVYQKNELALPYTQLQKLALFINCKFEKISSSTLREDIVGSAQQITAESKINVAENKDRNSGDMDQHSPEKKDYDRVKTFMDISNTK